MLTRRRRHHPGHPAGLLLRPDRPDHRRRVRHPMAAAMNIIGYDAAALGNHEFNYGIDTLRTFEEQLDFPLLGANAVDAATRRPAFPPYVIKYFTHARRHRCVKVGILGLTNPGIAIWDKANVEGRHGVPGPRRAGARSSSRSCARPARTSSSCPRTPARDTSSSYGDALPYPENAATLVAAAGARHRRDPGRPRAPGDRGALGHQRGHRRAGPAHRAALLGHAAVGDRPRPRRSRAAAGRSPRRQRPGAQLQHRRRGPRGRRRAARSSTTTSSTTSTRSIGTSAQAMSAARAVVEDVADHRLRQLRAGRRGEAGARRHRRRRAARASASRRRSTATPRSRRARSPSATSRGSTSTTTPCWR